MSQMKVQDKPPEKTTKWSGDRQPTRNRIQNNDTDDDAGSQKQNEKLQDMFIKDLERQKNKQMKNILEHINSRITEKEE